MKKVTEIKEFLRTWIEIDRKAVQNNYQIFRKIAGKKLLMSVVKSNAYGHGLVVFSKILNDLDVDWFGVDSIVEANTLRRNGIKKPILVLGYTLPLRYSDAVKNKISVTIPDFVSLDEVIKLNKKISIHIKVDTGMHRQGFMIEEIPKVIDKLKNCKNIKFEGLYTHLSSAKNPEDMRETDKQIEKFKLIRDIFLSVGYEKFLTHVGATAGTILLKDEAFDMTRVGIGMYGLWPSKEMEEHFKDKYRLKLTLTWKSIVSQIKEIKKGEGVGYDLTEKVKRNTKIAIIPIGYWHGYGRNLSSKGEVLVHGHKCKVLGRISMDMIVIDITDVKKVKVLDEVILIGQSKGKLVSSDDLADKYGTTSYELLTRLNPLIERIVV
jgi:alanine racemase